MHKQFEPGSPIEENLLTRRTMLGGLVTAALTPILLGEGETAGAEPQTRKSPVTAYPVPEPSALKSAVPMSRAFHTITSLPDGRLLVAGGISAGNRALSGVQIYDPKSDTWTDAAAMSMARFQHATTLLADGRVLVTGGLHRSSRPLNGGEIYTPASDTWMPAPPMTMARYGHTLSLQADGRVIVMGGCSTGPVSSMEIYTVADAI